MGKYETLAGLLTLLTGVVGVATAILELRKAALELRRTRRAGRAATRAAARTDTEMKLTPPRAAPQPSERAAERRSRGEGAHTPAVSGGSVALKNGIGRCTCQERRAAATVAATSATSETERGRPGEDART